MKKLLIVCICLLLVACGEQGENWKCSIKGGTMFSISYSGNIAGARKGCSCSEIRNFELNTFGEVDRQELRNDFDC